MNTTDGGNQWTFIPGFPKHGREKHACFVNHGTNMLHVIGGKKYSLHSKIQQIHTCFNKINYCRGKEFIKNVETINLDFILKNKPDKAKDHGDKLNYGVQDPKVVQLCEFFISNNTRSAL